MELIVTCCQEAMEDRTPMRNIAFTSRLADDSEVTRQGRDKMKEQTNNTVVFHSTAPEYNLELTFS